MHITFDIENSVQADVLTHVYGLFQIDDNAVDAFVHDINDGSGAFSLLRAIAEAIDDHYNLGGDKDEDDKPRLEKILHLLRDF